MKKLSLLLAVMMLFSLVNVTAFAQPEEIVLPIVNEPLTLTAFNSLNPKVSKTLDNYDKIACYQELAKRTGITLKFVHPAQGSEIEQYNLMCTSGEFTDIIFLNWEADVNGGMAKAMEDGSMIDLSEAIEKWAPNLSRILEEYPEVRKSISTDDGRIGYFPTVYANMLEVGQDGFFLRADWLEKLGLDFPKTIDEWHDVLVAFRDQDPNGNGEKDEIPFASAGFGPVSCFAYAWGLNQWNNGNAFVVRDGKAIYSPYDPAFREFVSTMAQWYAEGLIDPEYLSRDQNDVNNLITTSVAGSGKERNSATGALIKVFRNLGDEKASLIGTWYPIANENYVSSNPRNFLAMVNGSGTAISSSCENVEAAVKMLDYLYSPEGSDLMNWGPETEDNPIYTIDEDGVKHLSDWVKNNPDGLSQDQAISIYSIGAMDGSRMFPPVMYHERQMIYPEQTITNARWDEADNSGWWPPVSFTMDELEEVSEIQSELNVYVAETVNKMIMGQLNTDSDYDAFVKQMENMGVERLIELHQDALERFNAR